MASLDTKCDVSQGFNYRKDVNSTVGFVTNFTIGGITGLQADITCKDPMSPDTDVKVFAVCSNVNWGLAATDPLYFAGQVSINNRKAIATALMNDMTQIDVKLKFDVYEYDPSDKKYFKAFHSNGKDMEGRILKNGKNLAMSVASYASDVVQSPENYGFSVAIVPESKEQELHLAVSCDAKFVKQWGVKDRE